jgi:fumarylacetoacetase
VSDDGLTDATNDPARRSWLASANAEGCDFPIQNLPFAVFRRRGRGEPFRGGIGIGDQILDFGVLGDCAAFQAEAARGARAANQPALNALMQLGTPVWRALRRAVFDGLLEGAPLRSELSASLVPQSDAEYSLPARIGDFTDFYSSIHHATTIGRMFRPENPLLPNYKWVPIGYHGRSSSIVVSGHDIARPQGQRLPPGREEPVVGPSARLDFELELGLFIGAGNALGTPIPMSRAESHIFGMCLLNDWSARDLQAWEYQPLGPFLAKNFATTISPWVISLQALAPFRTTFTRPVGDPAPLAYLDSEANRAAGAIDIRLEALLQTAAMEKRGAPPQRLSSSSFRHSYWTVAQLVSHHTVNGCNLVAGDLLGTGTQSGPSPAEAGSLVELSAGGKKPIRLGDGEQRSFLEDGDTLILKAWCERPGAARIGFGEARGRILASPSPV